VIEGAETRKKSENLRAVSFIVSQAYFRTLDIPLVVGRTFNDNDREGSLPVAAINRSPEAQNWPGGDAIGRRFHFVGEDTWRQAVGVVKNANYSTLGEAPQRCIYLPQKQNFAGGMTLYVRSQENPANLLLTIQRQVRMLDSNIETSDARTGAMLLDQVLWGPKVGVALLGMFGSLALASVGLYGVIAYSVTPPPAGARRTHDPRSPAWHGAAARGERWHEAGRVGDRARPGSFSGARPRTLTYAVRR